MQPFIPHTIHHVPLNHHPGIEPGFDYDQAGYFVFWWKNIPLGHVYLPDNKSENTSSAIQIIINSIGPAIDFYQQKSGNTENWRTCLHNSDWEHVQALFQQLFLPYEPQTNSLVLPVSVVICTRNRTASLKRCILSLDQQVFKPAEIIIVDNAPSADDTFLLIASFPNIVYVKEPRKGLDIARNTGARKASCKIVAYIDDDIHLHPLWLYHVWETFEHSGTAAMTGLVLTHSLQTEAQWIFENFWAFNRGYADKFYSPGFLKETRKKGPPVWIIGAGANMAFRKEVLEEVGYFDERLDAGAAGCNGDSECWFRILNRGYTIHYNPRAVLMHEHRTDLPGLKQQLSAYMRGFTTACLIQQQQLPEAGYNKHLLYVLPKYYIKLLLKGFPAYRSRYKTVFAEIKGVINGWCYYLRHRKDPSITYNDVRHN